MPWTIKTIFNFLIILSIIVRNQLYTKFCGKPFHIGYIYSYIIYISFYIIVFCFFCSNCLNCLCYLLCYIYMIHSISQAVLLRRHFASVLIQHSVYHTELSFHYLLHQ